MAQDVGHGHGGHGASAQAHGGHGGHGDGHGEGAHGHHASALTAELSGTLGVIAAISVAVLGVFMDKTLGPVFPPPTHHAASEAGAWPTPLPGPADVIIKHAKVRQPGFASASVIAIRNGKITGVGGDELLARRTATTIEHDMNGAYVLPGLRDAHGHLAGLGATINQRNCDLSEVNGSVEDVVRAFETWIKIRKGEPKPGEVLVGRGWDESKWTSYAPPSKEDLIKADKDGRDFTKDEHQGFRAVPGKLPESTELLDQIAPYNPVILYRVDGHTAWVNNRALELAKIDKGTFNPPGGRILRDKDGEPTGVLVDEAISLVLNALPKKSDDQQVLEAEEDILAGALACARAGLVEVHDAGVTMNQELALRRLAKANRLPIRVYAMVTGSRDQIAERLSRPGPVKEPIGDRLTVRAVKLIADGAMGSRGALLLEPYKDQPGTPESPYRGLRTLARDEIAATARLCLERGWQLCVHAIGDATNREVLDVFEEVQAGKADLRWRIEHAQLVNPADWSRFAKLGVIASMQPTHATSDMRWAEDRVGADRLAGAYAWRSLLDAHARLAFGSDFPVESERPALGLYAAVTRQDAHGKPEGGWRPKERLTPLEALRLFTEDAAYASFGEQQRGKIAIGMDADLTAFNHDPLEVLATTPRSALALDPNDKQALKVVGTFVGGKDARKAP